MGSLITHDRDIFDQCTDTIVRQVDDIKRMVDESLHSRGCLIRVSKAMILANACAAFFS